MLCGFGILIIINSRGVVFKVPKFTFDVVKMYIYMYTVQCIIVLLFENECYLCMFMLLACVVTQWHHFHFN